MPIILRNHLKELRARYNLNQSEMANLCGISRQTVSLIERGDYSPSITLALTLAQVLKVRVEDLFELEAVPESEEEM